MLSVDQSYVRVGIRLNEETKAPNSENEKEQL
jgi:hypothetical protein